VQGPFLRFNCKPHRKQTPGLDIPVRLLMRHSIQFEAAMRHAGYYTCDPWSDNKLVGEIEVAEITKTNLTKIQDYLNCKVLVISAGPSGNEMTTSTLDLATQISLFAYLFDIEELQRIAMHILWHCLITMRQEILYDVLQDKADGLAGDCPAKQLLKSIVKNKHGNATDLVEEPLDYTAFDLNSSSKRAARTLEEATSTWKSWAKISLPEDVIQELCRHGIDDLWRPGNRMGYLVEELKNKITRQAAEQQGNKRQEDPSSAISRGVQVVADVSDPEYWAWKRDLKLGDEKIQSPSGLDSWVDNPANLPKDALIAQHHKALARVEDDINNFKHKTCAKVERALNKNLHFQGYDEAIWQLALEEVYYENVRKGYAMTRMPQIIPAIRPDALERAQAQLLVWHPATGTE
jgi:hypothetical protein